MSVLLLVDDQPKNLLALEAVLRAPHRELVSVESGQRAIEEALRRPLSLVLLDVMMPRMDGLETALALKRFVPRLPIIFLSALAEDEVAESSRGMGDEYMSKPFDPAVLRRKIARYEGVSVTAVA